MKWSNKHNITTKTNSEWQITHAQTNLKYDEKYLANKTIICKEKPCESPAEVAASL